MRFALTSDHRNFYLKHGYIEFENLLSNAQVEILQQSIEACLKQRLKTSKKSSPQTRFDQGFDLWRESIEIKKMVFGLTLSEIAAQLFQVPLLRIGFDQYYDISGQEHFCPFSLPQSIQEVSCAKPLLGALLLTLAPPSSPASSPFPGQCGSGVYFNPQKIIDWKTLFDQKGAHYIAIAYAAKTTLYHFEPKDPHTHSWKSLGYVFGDPLKDTTHPVIYRS